MVKNLTAMRETWIWSLGWEDPLEKGKATHSSILAWRIPWTVKSRWSKRVRHDRVTFTFIPTTKEQTLPITGLWQPQSRGGHAQLPVQALVTTRGTPLYQGDKSQHTLRKEVAGIHTKNSPHTKNVKTWRLQGMLPQKDPSKTTAENCFS